LISFSSYLSTLVIKKIQGKIRGNNSTVPPAWRISVSLSCLSLGIASLAMTQAAWCTLKDPAISKDREDIHRKDNTPASLVANITPRSFRAVVM
jgi:hypothetical protein